MTNSPIEDALEALTQTRSAARRRGRGRSNSRSYRQHCGLARALDVVGSRWTLLIVRNLLLGPLSFGSLMRSLPGIASNTLTDRLRAMERDGLVHFAPHPRSRKGGTYVLTSRGEALEPAIHALGEWGWPLMAERTPDDRVNPAWGMLALKRRFQPGTAAGRVELVIDRKGFTVDFGPEQLRVRRGGNRNADASIHTEWSTLAPVFYEGRPLRASLEETDALILGDAAAVRSFATAFDLVP